MDRAEATGFGVALAGHGALIAILSMGFANAVQPPLVNPPIEVSFVDEVGLQSAVTEVSTEPPARSVAPELGAPEEAAPAPAEMPKPAPIPKQAINSVSSRPAPAKAEPDKPKASQTGKAKQTQGSTLGDILKGIGGDPSSSKSQKPAGAVMSAQAMSNIGAAILRQVQPCANRMVNPGPGANRIKVMISLKLNRDGSLQSRPVAGKVSGVDDENRRYVDRVKELAVATFTGCSPLRGLPPDLYDVRNGWSDFDMTYKLP